MVLKILTHDYHAQTKVGLVHFIWLLHYGNHVSYGTNQPQVKRMLCVVACACTYVFACYVYTRVAVCCTTKSHASASVT